MFVAVRPKIIRSLAFLQVLQLPVDWHFGLKCSQTINSLRSITSYTLKYPRRPKQFQIVCEVSGLQNNQFSFLPLPTRAMESECDSETLDVEEKMKTISTCKPKRQRERDSATGSTMSPPPKKSQQSLSSSIQPRSLSEYSEGESELNECNQLTSEPAVACSNITSTGTSSYNTTPEHPCVKVADTSYHKMLTSLPGISGSNLSLSKSVSGDSLDQEFSWGESENISSGVFETECESLTSSQILPDDSIGEAKESKTLIDAVKVLDGAEEIAPSTKKDKRKRTKERKRKNWKKHGKKAVDSVDGEETKSKNVRPNYFLAIQVTNADIHKAIVKVQEDMMASYEFLARSFVDVATSHLTLLVAHIDTEESLTVAQSAVEECCNRVMEEVRAKPILLTFSGVSNFSNQVVFAQLVEDEEYNRLLKFAESVRNVFSEKGVCMPDTRALNPHLTILKLSKASRVKGKHTTRRIDPSCYKQHLDLHFGCQTVCGLQLLSMEKSKDENRYYYNAKETSFGIESNENTDHSQCCFPRRPILKSKQPKHQRSYSTGSASPPEAPPSWLLPTVGVMTALAAAIVLSLIVIKVRGKP